MSSLTENKVQIFVSYKHDDIDEEILDQLMAYIHKPITDVGGQFWFDKRLKWGDFWDATIQEQLLKADIGIILVSMPFLTSTYINDVEIDALLKRREKKELIILPIIVRPCDWKSYRWLADTQFFPLKGKTVVRDYRKETGDRDELFQEILEHLRDRVREIKSKKTETPYKSGEEAVGGFSEPKLQILQNARKEEVTKDRSEFIYVAAKMTTSVHKSGDLDGSIRIATHSGGPWIVTHDGQYVSLDEVLSGFVREVILQKGRDAALAQVQIVCPFALSNLHYIRKWHIQGVGIRVHPSMNENIYKWLLAKTYAYQELLLGYPSGTLELPTKGPDGLVLYGKASTGFRTKDLYAVEYYSSIFDNLYRDGQSMQGRGANLLAMTLIEFINKTFQHWDNDKAKLLQSGHSTIAFEKRQVTVEITWQESTQIFSIDILSDNKNDAATLKRHFEILREGQEYEHYHLDDTLQINVNP